MTIRFPQFLILIFFLSFVSPLPVPAIPDTHSAFTEPEESLLEQFGVNKVMPNNLQEVILTALSHYPELKKTAIEFVLKDHIRHSVMQAQPKFSSIFKGKANREYVVNISRNLELNDRQVDISTLPSNVLVGWIAHELGHIIDYKDRGNLNMIGFGIHYMFSDDFIIDAERRADLYALQHGLAENVIDTKKFVLNNDEIPEVYKDRIRRLYLSPEDYILLLGDITDVTP